MANELTLTEMQAYAKSIVASGFCGFTKPEEVVTLALIAQDEGRSIGSVARDYHIIKGKPTLKADAMLARFQSAGGKIDIKDISDTHCAIEFFHPSAGKALIEWTIDMAKKAGLTGNPTWQKFPRAMLRARVISEGIRTTFPAVICGTYTPEEIEDMEDASPKQRKADPAPSVDKETPVNPPSRMKANEAPVVQDAEVITPYSVFREKLKDYYKSYPEQFEALKKWMDEQGWKRSEDVPSDRYEDVYAQFERIVDAG